jgi:hypothetical protein
METFDVARATDAIRAMKRQTHLEKADPAKYLPAKELAIRKAVERRLMAQDMLTGIKTPHLDEVVQATPFAIWDFSNGVNANFLLDSEITSIKWCWAKFRIFKASGDPFIQHDQVVFYSFWRNDTGSSALLDVEASLYFRGHLGIDAKPGLIWSPFWGQGNQGECQLLITAELALMDFWTQPPTEPLPQPGQKHILRDLSASGGFFNSEKIAETITTEKYRVYYDVLEVPRDHSMLFELSLNFYYGGRNAEVFFESDDYHRVEAAPVQLHVRA